MGYSPANNIKMPNATGVNESLLEYCKESINAMTFLLNTLQDTTSRLEGAEHCVKSQSRQYDIILEKLEKTKTENSKLKDQLSQSSYSVQLQSRKFADVHQKLKQSRQSIGAYIHICIIHIYIYIFVCI